MKDYNFHQAQLWAIAMGSILLLVLVWIVWPQTPIVSQPQPMAADLDNLYHEDENLADDADVFPRMGHTTGNAQSVSNCRAEPWGSIVTRIPGDAFVEIRDRTVDSQGESWFYIADAHCWIHDSRVDLL